MVHHKTHLVKKGQVTKEEMMNKVDKEMKKEMKKEIKMA